MNYRKPKYVVEPVGSGSIYEMRVAYGNKGAIAKLEFNEWLGFLDFLMVRRQPAHATDVDLGRIFKDNKDFVMLYEQGLVVEQRADPHRLLVFTTIQLVMVRLYLKKYLTEHYEKMRRNHVFIASYLCSKAGKAYYELESTEKVQGILAKIDWNNEQRILKAIGGL